MKKKAVSKDLESEDDPAAQRNETQRRGNRAPRNSSEDDEPRPSPTSSNVKNPNLESPDEEMLRKQEIKEKARKRSRGPYRKSSAREFTKRV